MQNWRVPFNSLRPALQVEEERLTAAFDRVVKSGNLILGPEVEAFEKAFANELGYGYAVGVANGTDAIELALRSMVAPGMDVLTVANSAPATAAAIVRAGMNPVFCEIRPDGLIDPATLGHFMTPMTKAIVPVDLYGRWVDRDAIMKFARDHNLVVVEDAAQAYGSLPEPSSIPNTVCKPHAICYSFYPTKALGAIGDGGAIATDMEHVASLIKAIRFYGITEGGRSALKQSMHGVNSRLDELQAAILQERMKFAYVYCSARRDIARRYYEKITDHAMPRGWSPLFNYHLFTINVENRDWFRAKLMSKGIQTAIHYPTPAHRQKPTEQVYRSLPITESFCNTTLSLPCWYGMSDEQVTAVIDAVNDTFLENER